MFHDIASNVRPSGPTRDPDEMPQVLFGQQYLDLNWSIFASQELSSFSSRKLLNVLLVGEMVVSDRFK
jgi:hypothetical protein